MHDGVLAFDFNLACSGYTYGLSLAQGLITATWRMSEAGRERKYYRLTAHGHQMLDAEKREWLDVHTILVQLWGNAPQFT